MFTAFRLQIAAWYVGILALILGSLGGFVYFNAEQILDKGIDDSIRQARDELILEIDSGSEPAITYGAEDWLVLATDVPSNIVFVITDGASVVANPRHLKVGDFELQAEVEGLDSDAGVTEVWGTLDVNAAEEMRFLTVPLSEGLFLHTARSMESRDDELGELLTILVLGGLVGLLLASVGGVLVAGRSITPIRRSIQRQRQFTSDASHEIRTPLAVIRSNAELLLRHSGASIESMKDEVDTIVSEAHHLSELVGGLSALAEGDEARLHLSRETFDIADLIGGVVAHAAALAAEERIGVRVDAGGAIVHADLERIRQVLGILLDNAIKYTPAGGSVTVTSNVSGRWVEITVRDTGPGIPAEHQQRIFDRFYRVDRARSREVGGSGLGLAIARSIIQAHGGEVSVESSRREGTTFTVRLPGAN